MRSLALRVGLPLADLVVRSLPRGLAYAMADRLGRTWHRRSEVRRTMVAANLARVCAATGRPTSGPAFNALVERAFVEYARYYLELLRAPHYQVRRLDSTVSVDDWEAWRPRLHEGMVVVSLHLGNFEPFGLLLAAEGLRAVAPVEETRPRELFEFLRARRAAGRVEVVPLSRSRRPMIEALRSGGIAALIADRDLSGHGHPVTMFGHPTTLPTGPAALAVISGRPLLVAACIREAPEQFRARVWLVESARTGDRQADTAALTEAMGQLFEEAIAIAPEQWFAAFQPYWLDQRAAARGRSR
jgi:KDO2-lipid IV(A) lauroyltransferase